MKGITRRNIVSFEILILALVISVVFPIQVYGQIGIDIGDRVGEIIKESIQSIKDKINSALSDADAKFSASKSSSGKAEAELDSTQSDVNLKMKRATNIVVTVEEEITEVDHTQARDMLQNAENMVEQTVSTANQRLSEGKNKINTSIEEARSSISEGEDLCSTARQLIDKLKNEFDIVETQVITDFEQRMDRICSKGDQIRSELQILSDTVSFRLQETRNDIQEKKSQALDEIEALRNKVEERRQHAEKEADERIEQSKEQTQQRKQEAAKNIEETKSKSEESATQVREKAKSELKERANIRPVVFALAPDSSDIQNEDLLFPSGFSVAQNERLEVTVVGIDDSKITNLQLFYMIDQGDWLSVESVMDVSQDFLAAHKTLAKSPFEIKAIKGQIPEQSAGSVVRFLGLVEDSSGNIERSPFGLYYVTDSSKPPVLIVDPHVRLWLLQENSQGRFNSSFSNLSNYGKTSIINENLLSHPYLNNKPVFENYLENFKQWQKIAGDYNIKIIEPRYIADYLDGFSPQVIVLSSLSLGIEESEFFDWEFTDSEFELLKNYIKENNAGLVVTHSSLSDFVVWKSCDNQHKIGSRDNIGNSINDIKTAFSDERTVSALMGLPQLAIYEDVKDKVAQSICATNPPAGQLVGSMPLHIPRIAFNGEIQSTQDAQAVGIDIPRQFSIKSPNFENAFTQVGWQLAVPRMISSDWSETIRNESNISVSDSISKSKLTKDGQLAAKDWGISSFLNEIGSQIDSDKVNAEFRIADQNVEFGLDNSKDVLSKLKEHKPLKLVAKSTDNRAGIITFDKFWVQDGYRSVYISFEPETAIDSGKVPEDILGSSIDWAKNWQYESPKESASEIRENDKICFLWWCF